MTNNLNLHARLAVKRVSEGVRRALADHWRGGVGPSAVRAAVKGLRAQSRATRQIAPREAEAILGAAALIEIRLDAAVRAYADHDIPLSDDHLREALNVIEVLQDTLGAR